ncbi:hypothetical protein QAD02_006599 [Eretmocerus hayati]|uniref:Uncharacterized protein n=1 Tax=Eretmocerus hayati TaxID=131215 RepID=A0ACC2N1F0_9HYME|nr:hypothetical protein QAD02_006599 [Eretmocerus hayati]
MELLFYFIVWVAVGNGSPEETTPSSAQASTASQQHESQQLRQNFEECLRSGSPSRTVDDSSFNDVAIVDENDATDINGRIFHCNCCGYQCKLEQTLYQHLEKHKKDQLYLYEICRQILRSPSDFMKQMTAHSGPERTLSCEICQEIFKQKGHLDEHMTKHTVDRPFTCQICSKKFKTSSDWEKHVVRSHSHRQCRLPCRFCGKIFAERNDFKSHIKLHCPICHKECRSEQILIIHVRGHQKRVFGTNQEDQQPEGGPENIIEEVGNKNGGKCHLGKVEYECNLPHSHEPLDALGMPACSSGTHTGSGRTAATTSNLRHVLENSPTNSCEREIGMEEESDYIETEQEMIEYALDLTKCGPRSDDQLQE